MSARLYCGDVRTVLAGLPGASVQCVVTSPPYWGLRDYGVAPVEWGGDSLCSHSWGETISTNATNHTDKRRWNHTRNGRDEEQPTEKRVGWLRTLVDQGNLCATCGAWRGSFGLEPTPELYVEHLVGVFGEVRRVLRDDGVLWLNLGDSYAGGGGFCATAPSTATSKSGRHGSIGALKAGGLKPQGDVKAKDLVGIPWLVAFALRADGWYLRSEVIWAKPNPMPESVADRPTKAHEQVFLLSKSERYYYDADAIAEPGVTAEKENYPARAEITGRGTQGAAAARGNDRDKSGGFPPRKTDKQRGHVRRHAGFNDRWDQMERDEQCGHTRNARSVWTIATQPYPEAHFATFPAELARRCIVAGSKPGDTVLDPFGGSGTVASVATGHGRRTIYIDLNPAYLELARQRIGPLMCEEPESVA